MPASLAEDIVFIVFFFSLFTALMTAVPHIYRFLDINPADDLLIIVFWLSIFIVVGIILKYLQKQRYEDELDDILNGTIDGFDI